MGNNFIGTSVQSLCSSGQRPLLITGALVQWLRQHFLNPSSIEDKDLVQDQTAYTWSKDPANASIAIESFTRWDPSLVESRPAIIVKRNGWKRDRIGIDNRYLGGNQLDGSTNYSNGWAGSHTIFVLSGEGAECEKLATEVYRELNQFAPIMRKELLLMRLELTELGEMHILEEASDNFVVPITISYYFLENWQLTPAAPPLRAVTIK